MNNTIFFLITLLIWQHSLGMEYVSEIVNTTFPTSILNYNHLIKTISGNLYLIGIDPNTKNYVLKKSPNNGFMKFETVSFP